MTCLTENNLEILEKEIGVDEGDRTLDRRSHNPELYQLSYVHHIRTDDELIPTNDSIRYSLTSLDLLTRVIRLRSTVCGMARPAGLEPATTGLEGRCSIQLSYGRINRSPT